METPEVPSGVISGWRGQGGSDDTLGIPLSELREAITTDGIAKTKRCIVVDGDRVAPQRLLDHLGLQLIDPD
jgi:hypothetical protein